MTLSTRSTAYHKSKPAKWTTLWFERVMAVLSIVSLTAVCFDLSYIPLRDFWLQGRFHLFTFKLGEVEYRFPREPIVLFPIQTRTANASFITKRYDPIKGIEPYRDTEAYLATVQLLNTTIDKHGLDSEQVEDVLEELRIRSEEMIDANPFEIANKTGTLERIKNLMRDRVEMNSSRSAFRKFWSLAYLEQHNLQEELDFFENRIQPLMETNYFRPIGENGRPFDNFGIIDFPLSIIFFVEFLSRTWFISRRRKGVSWRDAMLWRWYDIFLFLPFPYWLRFGRLLRGFAVVIRLSESHLIDLHKIKKQASQGFVAGIAEDLTEVVVVSLLNQVQGSIQRGELTSVLAQQNQNEYIDLNDTNEIAEITRLVTQVVVKRVIPAARKDIEALLEYSIDKALREAPMYQGLNQLPGMKAFRENLTHQIIHGLYDVLYVQICKLIEEDEAFDKLIEQLSETFVATMQNEMQTQQSIERMEYLLNALLEEVKVNYVQRLSEEDVEELMDQTRALHQVTQVSVRS